MKYENFDGPVEELVCMKIREIEEKEKIRVLHVVESGSRAWGFESPDSDYDVRFIYVREADFYLSLRDTKDYIDWELNDVLDINGWDIKKALQHFHKSNATLFESVLEEDMKEVVNDLLAKKIQMSESDKAPKIEIINEYIEKNLAYYKAFLEGMSDDRKVEWEPLEKAFIEIVKMLI